MSNKIEDTLKKAEGLKFQFDKDFLIAFDNPELEYHEKKALSYLHNGIDALYVQNQVLIEQNQEIIKYLEEMKK